jgi:hypothetical protein
MDSDAATGERPRDRKRFALLLAALLVAYLGFRVPVLRLDPPDSLVTHYQDTCSSIYDEGWWTANARQWALTGRFLGTGLDLVWVSPVFTVVESAAFAAEGVSLASARTVSLIAGAVSLWLLLALGSAGRDANGITRRVAVAASLWMAFSFAAAHFGRLALPETPGTAIGLAGAYLVVSGGAGRGFAAGLLAGLAFLTKPHFAFVAPALMASAAVLAVRRDERALPAALRVALGAAIPAGAWAAVVAAHRTDAAPLLAFYHAGRWLLHAPAGAAALVRAIKPFLQTLAVGVVYRHPLLTHLPLVLALAALAVPAVVGAVLDSVHRRDVSDASIVLGLWALAGGAAVSSLPFQPFRYFVPLFPALAWLAASTLFGAPPREPPDATAARSVAAGRVVAAARWVTVALLTAQATFAALYATLVPAVTAAARGGTLDPLRPVPFHVSTFLPRLVESRSWKPLLALAPQHAYFAATIFSGLAALVFGVAVATLLHRRAARMFPAARVAARFRRAAVVAIVGFQLALWILWWPQRADTIHSAGLDLGRRLAPDVIVSPGGTYSLDNRLTYSSAIVRDGRGKMFDASGAATHFLCLERHPRGSSVAAGEVEREYPGSERLAEYRFTGGYVYGLYRAVVPPRP